MGDVGGRNKRREISVIIPTYNVEKYIDQCLDSLQSQTFDNFEVLCVDDGSDDQTRERIREYGKVDSRIRLIEMPHCGLAGVMRNEGIRQAKGDYCLFLDGDDFFEPEMLEHSLRKVREDDADICMFDARMYYEATKTYKKSNVILKTEYIPEQIPFEGKFFPYIFNIGTGCPWTKLIKKSLIDENHIEFMALPRFNDVYFVFLTLALAKRVTILQEVLVNYRLIPTSLQANNTKTPWDWYDSLKTLREKLLELGIYSEVENSFRNLAFGVSIYNLCSLKSGESFCQVYERMKKEFFEEFDLADFKEEDCYSYNSKKYEIYRNMMQCTAGEYLFLEVQKLKEEKSYWVTRAKNAEKKNQQYSLVKIPVRAARKIWRKLK